MAICLRKAEEVRRLLRCFSDRRVPHLAVALSLIVIFPEPAKGMPTLRALLEHHSGADYINEPVRLCQPQSLTWPQPIRRLAGSQRSPLVPQLEEPIFYYTVYPIHIVACYGWLQPIVALHRAGADVLKLDCLRSSVLTLCASSGSVQAMKFFLSLGCDVLHKDHLGNTALHYAAAFGKHKVVDLLLEHGANPVFGNHFGQWPLSVAVERNMVKCVKSLAAYTNTCLINVAHFQSHKTALHLAAAAGYSECVQVLLRYGADPKLVDIESKTAQQLTKDPKIAAILTARSN